MGVIKAIERPKLIHPSLGGLTGGNLAEGGALRSMGGRYYFASKGLRNLVAANQSQRDLAQASQARKRQRFRVEAIGVRRLRGLLRGQPGQGRAYSRT